jgi:hypothetical protein
LRARGTANTELWAASTPYSHLYGRDACRSFSQWGTERVKDLRQVGIVGELGLLHPASQSTARVFLGGVGEVVEGGREQWWMAEAGRRTRPTRGAASPHETEQASALRSWSGYRIWSKQQWTALELAMREGLVKWDHDEW